MVSMSSAAALQNNSASLESGLVTGHLSQRSEMSRKQTPRENYGSVKKLGVAVTDATASLYLLRMLQKE